MRSRGSKSRNPPVSSSYRLELAARVRAARAILGWSQTELGKRVGLTQKSVYRLERCAVDVRDATAAALDAEFRRAGINFSELAGGGFTMVVRGHVLGKEQARKRKAPSPRQA